MNLDFVDPPLSPTMERYQPRIGPENVADELRTLAESFRTNEDVQQIYPEEALDQIGEGIVQPEVAEKYVEHIPFVARFLTVELDTTEPGKQAIGRVPGEGPPRFGGQYRRKLEQPEIRERVGPIFERLMFDGFAGAAGANATAKEPRDFIDRSIEERWRRFIRAIKPNYFELLKWDELPIAAVIRTVALQAQVDYMEVIIEELRIGKGLGRRHIKIYPTFLVAAGYCIWNAFTQPD